jgi:hypothetical protein
VLAAPAYDAARTVILEEGRKKRMTIVEAVEMFRALRDDKPFAVNFALQHSTSGGLTIQELIRACGEGRLADFFERLAVSEPPQYPDKESA